jgi:hypothetical protein
LNRVHQWAGAIEDFGENMAIYQTMTFLRSPKELIQAGTYERIVLEFMNESRTIFPEKYSHVEEQSHGEPDFISNSGIRYDAKLLFSTEQCKFLEKGDEELIHWIKSVKEELGQASRMLMSGNLRDIHTTRLYGEILRRLPKESIIENTIYFTPYPIVPAFENSFFGQLASDIISVTYDALIERNPKKFINKLNYIIHPSSDFSKIVLQKLGSYTREYSSIAPLLKYINFSIINDPNLDADIIFYK